MSENNSVWIETDTTLLDATFTAMSEILGRSPRVPMHLQKALSELIERPEAVVRLDVVPAGRGKLRVRFVPTERLLELVKAARAWPI